MSKSRARITCTVLSRSSRTMLTFEQRVAYLRCKRRVANWVRGHRLIVFCLAAVLVLLTTRYLLHTHTRATPDEKHIKQDNQPARDQTQQTREQHVTTKPEVKNGGSDTRQRVATEKTIKVQDKAPVVAASKPKTRVVAPTSKEFLSALTCIMRSAIGYAGDDIRVLKQTTSEAKLVDAAARASLTAIARRLRHIWPKLPLSSLSDHAIDDVMKGVTNKDDTGCKLPAIDVPLSELEIVINPLDSHYELLHDDLHYVTTSACVLYRGKPLAAVIHQPFLKRSFYSYIGPHREQNPKAPILQDKGKAKISIGKEQFAKAKSILGDSALPNVLSGGVDYAALSVLFDASKQTLSASDAQTHLRFQNVPHRYACAGDVIVSGYSGRYGGLVGTNSKPDYRKNPKEVTLKGLWITLKTAQADEEIKKVYKELEKLVE